MAAPLDETLRVRVSGRLIEQLDAAAAARLIDRSDYARIALVDRLRADGVGGGCWGQAIWGGDLYQPKSVGAR